ncbi:DAK2 domain-containing protein [bacterium]|nr:DAK2 domain-containing protein [bacterium]MDY3861909.1 DAK2 domain-containing protein [Ruminococcus sp.]
MINGETLKKAVISGSNNICNQKFHINDLNIFPVPDGDTGTNMSMTTSAAVKALEELPDNAAASQVASVVASAMLRGARGNSGVILSLLFRGFAQGLQDKTEPDGADLAAALGLGVDAAYKAVMKPTEGTILTVARMAYEAGEKAAQSNSSVTYVLEAMRDAAYVALEQTPQLLPVLKRAGVVDAGGKGLCVILDGMVSVVKDGKMIEYVNYESADSDDEFTSAAAQFDDDINFTYCTEFIVGRDEEKETDPNELRLFLETIGDCVVVVSDEEIIKVHVHTEQPGDALKEGLKFGQLLTVKVENMKEQHKNAKSESNKSKNEEEKQQKFEPQPPEDEIGFVAVAAGEGVKELFVDLGCNNVVSGGQSMNPSTDDIYEAVMATPAKNVIVLPNNKNIIMAAEQTVPMVKDRNVIIVPTKTIPQGMSAMLAFDPDVSPEGNKQMMSAAAKEVMTGQVTFAARDSEFGGKKIKQGEIIALENGKLTICEKSKIKAAVKLAKNLITKDTSFVTVIFGEDTTEDEANEVYNALNDKFGSHVDITLVNGGQPVYYFILSVE